MEIIIYGTKDGHRILFSSNENISRLIAYDKRTGDRVKSDEQLGQSIYSIALIQDGGCFFSKYTIIKDSLRSFSVGYIAFSIFLKSNEKMEGKNILNLLDDLSGKYAKEHIKENCINSGEHILKIEDWSYFERRKAEIETELRIAEFNGFQTLNKEAASFVIYSDMDELTDLFNQPFQKKYINFKETLFIDKNLYENNIDPLNLIRNSGIQLDINSLRAEYRVFVNSHSFPGLTILINHEPIPVSNDKIYIGANDEISIKYEKDKRYYKVIDETGKISDDQIGQYLKIEDDQIKILNHAFSNPSKIPKDIKFNIAGCKDRIGADTEIICEPGNKVIDKINDTITFTGEELGMEWTVWAKQGEDIYSDKKTIVPEITNSTQVLYLREYKWVEFKGENDEIDGYLDKIKISIPKKGIDHSNPKVRFSEDEFDEKFTVIATFSNQGYKFKGKEKFTPKDHKEVFIKLQKVIERKYLVKVDDQRVKFVNFPAWSNCKDGSDVESKILAKNGWEFSGFSLDESEKFDDYDGTLIAHFNKRRLFAKPISKLFLVVLGLFAIATISFLLLFKKDSAQKVLSSAEIQNYVKDIYLNADTLHKYADQWNAQRQPIENIDFNEISQIIKNAIKKRKFINTANFAELKELHYSDQQSQFKNAITNVDSSQYLIISSRLLTENLSNLTLNQIAAKIHSIKTDINNPDYAIISYLEGVEFNLDTLKRFKPQVNSDSIEKRIDQSISLREYLNFGEVSKLRNLEYQYSTEQAELADIILLINDNNRRFIGDAMNNDTISKMDLNKIAKFISQKIDEFNDLTLLENYEIDQQSTIDIVEPDESKYSPSPISSQLQSDAVTKDQLSNWLESANDNEKRSIEIYSEFWNLVSNNANQKEAFDSMLIKIRKDNILKDSELNRFLSEICKNSKAFEQKYKKNIGRIPKTPKLSLKNLEEKLKK